MTDLFDRCQCAPGGHVAGCPVLYYGTEIVIPLPPDDATVERVAKALHEHDGDWCPVTWQQLTENGRNDYREQARAALRALGEPQQDERPGFVGMFRGAPDLSVRAKDIARGREDDDDA